MANAAGLRKAFLLRIVEQFHELAGEIGAPFQARADYTGNEAILSITRRGEEDEALRVVARFVDDSDGMEEKLALFWECGGEVTRVLGLGWKQSTPDVSAGLDSPADHLDRSSAYTIARVSHGLRADIARVLHSRPGTGHSLPAVREPHRTLIFDTPPASDRVQNLASEAMAPAVAERQEPNITLLQSALGELATKVGLKAEMVFASFIAVARSASSLKQGDIVAYAQGAILEVALCYEAFLSRGRYRASDLEMEPLRLAVVRAKAALFEQNEAVRWQFARELVTGMRLYYGEVLASRGVSDAQAKEMLKTIFGRDGAIANDALAILAQPDDAKSGGVMARLLRRNAPE
jgi:hypothetical protein